MVSKVPGGTTRVSLGRFSARLLASRSTAGAKEPTWTGRVGVPVLPALGPALGLATAFKLRGSLKLTAGESLKNQVFASRGGTGSEAAILGRTSGTFVVGRTRTACCTSRTSAFRSVRWPDNGSRHGSRGGKAGRALLNLESHRFGFGLRSCGHRPRGRRGVMRRFGLRDGYRSAPRIVAFNAVDQRFGDSDLAARRIEC